MQQEIVEFINRRFKKTNAKWLDGNCYYFALILTQRFPELKIYYEGVDGHFLAGNGFEYYDYTGVAQPYREPILFEDLKKQDPLWYNNIVRDCIL